MAEKLFKNDMPKIPSQEPVWSQADSLGTKIEKALARMVQRVILWGWEFFAELMVQIFDASMKILQPGFARMSKPVIDHLRATPGLPDWVKSFIQAVDNEQGESKVMGQALLLLSAVVGPMFGGLAPLGRVFAYSLDKNLRSARPSISEATELWRRGAIDDKAYQIIIEDMGVPDVIAGALVKIAGNDINPNDLIFGLWRGLYDEASVRDKLGKVGVGSQFHDLWIEKSKLIPPYSDIIRILVREGFRDDIAAQFGYDDDYPDQINEFFAKSGYNPDWAKRIWRAHWQLPSPNQAYEMLHRGLISEGELSALLKTSDYPSFWRDKLEKISFNLYTRVDVRRLLQAHIITEDEALKAYKDMGYDEEKARKLTDFAIAGISNEEKDLTRTDILNLYEEGLIDRSAANGEMVKMGYDESEAEEILKIADVNIAKAARTDAINYVKERYQARTIDDLQARDELTRAGLKAQSVDRYLLAWKRINDNDVALPTMADLKRWFLNDRIAEGQFRDYLKQHKHTQANIDIYVAEILDQKAQGQNATG